MFGRNSIVKIKKKIPNTNAKNLPENSLPLPRNRKKTDIISLSHDVNDHGNSKSKSVSFRSYSLSIYIYIYIYV